MKKFILLFGEDVEVDVDGHFFVKSQFGGVVADFLDGILIEDDVLAVHFDTGGFLDGVGNHDGVDRAENLTRGSSLGGDLQLQAFQSLGLLESLVLDLLFLVSLLAHLFGQDLAVALGGEDGHTLRDEVVAAVAGLHGDDVVLIS